MDTKSPVPPLVDLITRAVALIEVGNVDSATEMLKEALEPSPVVAIAPALVSFEHAFRTACRKNDVQNACYVIFTPQSHEKMTVRTGGDMRCAALIGSMIRDAFEFRKITTQQAEKTAPNQIILPS